jgi:hypothetical protein
MSDLPSPIPTILAASNIALVVLGVAVVGFFIWTIRGVSIVTCGPDTRGARSG